MKHLLERLRGGLNWLQWVSLLTGILVLAAFNLLLTLFLPIGSHAVAWVNVAAALLAIGIAPYLLRTIDRVQQRADQKDNELRSLQAIAIDSALSPQYNLQSLLELAVKQATLTVDGEMGAFWLLDSRDPTRVAAQAFYSVPADRQYMLTEHLAETTEAKARQTGQPQRRQEIEETWSRDRNARLLQLRSTITLPIKNQDALLGLLLVGNRGGASPLAGFTDEDMTVLDSTAAALSVAVQNMRLTEEKQRRGEMLRALMSQTGEAVAASSDTKRLMQLLADAAAQILDCARVAVYAHQPDGQPSGLEQQMLLQPLAAHDTVPPGDAQTFPPLQINGSRLQLVAGASEGAGGSAPYVPSVSKTLDLSGAAAPLLDAPGYVFVLRSRDRRGIGLLCLLDAIPCPPSEDRDAFASALAAQAAVGLENALLGERVRLDAERDKHVAEVFQTSMMPAIPPRIAAFEFANKYQAALDESTLGGDFYDLFALGGDEIGIVMADVSGKGLKAAVQTAMVKYMLRGFAHESPRAPGDVLAHVNDVLSSSTSGFEGFVTLFFGVLDTASGELRYANAGHEPPLWRDATGKVAPLDGESGLPLGSLPEGAYETHARRLAPGDLVLLYTDGLTEARSPENVFLGTEGLEEYIAGSGESASDAVRSIYDNVRTFTGDNLRDDVAMLLLRHRS